MGPFASGAVRLPLRATGICRGRRRVAAYVPEAACRDGARDRCSITDEGGSQPDTARLRFPPTEVFEGVRRSPELPG
jgi:hypothetical protein